VFEAYEYEYGVLNGRFNDSSNHKSVAGPLFLIFRKYAASVPLIVQHT
jgi:hypothetical protein